MIDSTSLMIFIAASLALLIIPGPAVFYIIARTLEQGRLAGLISTLGITFASVIHVIFAALGLSALILKSAVMFNVIKYLGALYLIYLGLRTLLAPDRPLSKPKIQSAPLSKLFWQGFIVNMLNPKTAIFFLAFLPQFVDPGNGSVPRQFIMLGMIFVVLAVTSDSMYAILAGTAKQLLTRSSRVARIQTIFSGLIYLALGISTALFSTSHNK